MEGAPYSREGFQEVIDKTQELMTEKEKLLEKAHQEAKIENEKFEEERREKFLERMKFINEQYTLTFPRWYKTKAGKTITAEEVRNTALFKRDYCLQVKISGEGVGKEGEEEFAQCIPCAWREFVSNRNGGVVEDIPQGFEKFFRELMKDPDLAMINGHVDKVSLLAVEFFGYPDEKSFNEMQNRRKIFGL